MTGPLPRQQRSGDLAQAVSGRAAAVARAVGTNVSTGTVVGIDSTGTVTVNIGGNPLVITALPAMPLQIGDAVQVVRQGHDLRIIGLASTTALPKQGTIAGSLSGQSVPVTTSLGTSMAGCVTMGGYAPTAGDLVWLAWLGTFPLVVGPVAAFGSPGGAGTPPPVVPPTPPSTSSARQSFAAVGSGTYRSGWQSSGITGGNVMQGDYGYGSNCGAWFYGGRISRTLAGATVTKTEVWLARPEHTGGSYGSQPVHLCRVTNNTQPSGAPTFDTGHAVDVNIAAGQSGWYTIPNPIGQALVDSGGSLGVQAANPYVRLDGLPNSPNAGTLRLTWSR